MMSTKTTTLQKSRAYLWIGAAGVLIAAGYLGMSLDLPFGHLDQPGAGIFPIMAGVTLLAASLITIWEGWHLDPALRVEMPHGTDLKRLLGLVALLLGFFIALPLLGQLISSTIFCILLMRVISDLGWPRIVAYSVLMCGALYGVFVFLLKVPMPSGVLGYQ
jgi:putative tricarboxylic transport membrane protein